MQEAPTNRAANPSVEELLEFERLLFELSVRFANVPADQVVAAIESALLQLKQFPAYLNRWDSQQARNEGVFAH